LGGFKLNESGGRLPMKFRTVVSSGKEVLFAGHERGNSRYAEDWLTTGRWKISMSDLDAYLTERLEEKSFGSSIDRLVFCFEIADFEKWGDFFRASANYVSYRPRTKEIWSVGQLRWTDVKDLKASDQLGAVRAAMQVAILRIGEKPRKPKDFAYGAFAKTVKALLDQAPEEALQAKSAV
jgi:hypothetical protein